MRDDKSGNGLAAAICLLISLLLLGAVAAFSPGYPAFGEAESPLQQMVLIDPGHGGPDGGAVAADGTQEKHINLALALDLRDLLTVWGYRAEMTRDRDMSLHSDNAASLSQKKVSDMHNRLAMYQKADAVISIHQNHFEQSRYHGAQVFYSGEHPDSAVLGGCIRDNIQQLLQPDNSREMKKAGSGIFLLSHAEKPTVLVECGFLSNPRECDQLKTHSYRQEMAFAVACGYADYMNRKEEEYPWQAKQNLSTPVPPAAPNPPSGTAAAPTAVPGTP